MMIVVMIMIHSKLFTQISADTIHKSYDFVLYDDSDLFTMYQFNQNYISGYRILSRSIDEISSNKKINTISKLLFVGLFGMPLTHEEGHRSVLTHEKIGSISQPLFSLKGAAYVKGVTDETLINFKSNNFPGYIRLHTAGLESDYMLTVRAENLMFFNKESYHILKEEYVFRKFSLVLYYLTTFAPSLSPKIEEESNELERDIVGHDIWGMVRHLHRPEMEFYRYTNFDDLTQEEKSYSKKLTWRSLTNFLNPMLIGKINFKLSTNLKANAALGYSLAPFGDYFEQNFWANYKNKLHLSFYFREYMNKENLFLATGATLHDLIINQKFKTSIGFDIWNQPEELSFNADNGDFGANINVKLSYLLFNGKKKAIKNGGFFANLFYKTDGFLPEYASLEEDFGLRIGVFFSY